ncbi:histidinol dehydrogenase [Mariniblastus fucicola]|uniref:Histidinol dehydrogenase n=1 Tax=Mariniblastus fucicola TaxID=980251 RepID=A0A5B9PFL1_9BACT|nr:histidinol dehydrogenase [Mariniblastus fucicola]QEG25228.1 Histidinol dehydrogenase [Mariniblastus fucicola]
MLKIIQASEFNAQSFPHSIDGETLGVAQSIVDDVRENGETAIRKYAEKFGERTSDQPLLIPREELDAALARISAKDSDLLHRVSARIQKFAAAQLNCLSELTTEVPGGKAGHTIEPIEHAGCYAPAGRYALPSTVMMTAVTARVAGCKRVTVASPNPSDMILATAAVSGADNVLAVGGAHAISAMAYGFDGLDRCDMIAGPGNRFVTAAKKIVHGDCGIDMIAGPSELVLVADESADPATVAADLLGQAEHDDDARPFLITTSAAIADMVSLEVEKQVKELPSCETATTSITNNGAAIVCDSIDQAIDICNRIAPEHLELHVENADSVAAQIRNAGCIFIGHNSAEVFGDYGVGPNHTLPTSGTARFTAGLNVFTFLRVRTWLKLDAAPPELVADTARLAEIEGLIGHQQSALRRSTE